MSSGNEMSPRSPALIILSGLPGSGKTTFATALLREFPAVHIESDAVRRRIASNPRYTLAENRRVFDEVERRAASAIASGHVALIDATNLREQDRLRFFSLAAQSRVRVLAVRVLAPDRDIRRRLQAPRFGYSQAGPEIFERMRGRTERFTCPAIAVDTRYSLGPPLRLLVQLLKESNQWIHPVP